MATLSASLVLPKKLQQSPNQTFIPVGRLFVPAILESSKLKVLFLGVDHEKKLARTYTITHGDLPSNLTLPISQTIIISQHLKEEASSMSEKIDLLEAPKRLIGDGLESSSIDELQEVENQLEQSLSNIRARKCEMQLQCPKNGPNALRKEISEGERRNCS